MKNKYGFHLTEIIVVAAILSIVTVLGFPLYKQYTASAHRFEAEEVLSKLAIAMEQFHIEHNSYQQATLEQLKFAENIAKNHYRLEIASATDDDYFIVAKPLGKQAENDVICGEIGLLANGERKINGTGKIDECW